MCLFCPSSVVWRSNPLFDVELIKFCYSLGDQSSTLCGFNRIPHWTMWKLRAPIYCHNSNLISYFQKQLISWIDFFLTKSVFRFLPLLSWLRLKLIKLLFAVCFRLKNIKNCWTCCCRLLTTWTRFTTQNSGCQKTGADGTRFGALGGEGRA